MVLLEIVSRFLVQPVREGWAVFLIKNGVRQDSTFSLLSVPKQESAVRTPIHLSFLVQCLGNVEFDFVVTFYALHACFSKYFFNDLISSSVTQGSPCSKPM